jgi:hypothetical protein
MSVSPEATMLLNKCFKLAPEARPIINEVWQLIGDTILRLSALDLKAADYFVEAIQAGHRDMQPLARMVIEREKENERRKMKEENLKPLTELLSEDELRRRDVAKHNRVKRRIFKEFKKMPYADITPHESLAQKTIAKASRARNLLERRKIKGKKIAGVPSFSPKMEKKYARRKNNL